MENKRYKKEQDIHLTKEEYLAQLKKYLKRLPKEDYNNAMDYFTEYFEDAGPEGEAALIQELGTPKEAAYEILDNLRREKTQIRRFGRLSFLHFFPFVPLLSAVLWHLL